MYKLSKADRRNLGIAGHGYLDFAGMAISIILGLYMFGCGAGIPVFEAALSIFGMSCLGQCIAFVTGGAIILGIVCGPFLLGLKYDPYVDFHSS